MDTNAPYCRSVCCGYSQNEFRCGESEAIVLASEQSADFIILDDWQARQIALGLLLPVIGTAAVLAKAEEKGLISDLASVIEELRKSGFYFL